MQRAVPRGPLEGKKGCAAITDTFSRKSDKCSQSESVTQISKFLFNGGNVPSGMFRRHNRKLCQMTRLSLPLSLMLNPTSRWSHSAISSSTQMLKLLKAQQVVRMKGTLFRMTPRAHLTINASTEGKISRYFERH